MDSTAAASASASAKRVTFLGPIVDKGVVAANGSCPAWHRCPPSQPCRLSLRHIHENEKRIQRPVKELLEERMDLAIYLAFKKNGTFEAILSLLEHGVSINYRRTRSGHSESALMAAIFHGRIDLMKLFRDRWGAEVTVREFRVAAERNNVEALKLLVEWYYQETNAGAAKGEDVKEKDVEIARWRAKAAVTDDLIQSLEHIVAEKDGVIAQLRRELEEARTDAETQAGEVARLQIQLSVYADKAVNDEQRLGRAEIQLAELQAQNAALHEQAAQLAGELRATKEAATAAAAQNTNAAKAAAAEKDRELARLRRRLKALEDLIVSEPERNPKRRCTRARN